MPRPCFTLMDWTGRLPRCVLSQQPRLPAAGGVQEAKGCSKKGDLLIRKAVRPPLKRCAPHKLRHLRTVLPRSHTYVPGTGGGGGGENQNALTAAHL